MREKTHYLNSAFLLGVFAVSAALPLSAAYADRAAPSSPGHGCAAAVMNKEAMAEDFFRLSTGLAGEAAQKFVNCHFRLALTGDFSMYESQPLQDFMRESNKGRHLYFCRDEQEALLKLGT